MIHCLSITVVQPVLQIVALTAKCAIPWKQNFWTLKYFGVAVCNVWVLCWWSIGSVSFCIKGGTTKATDAIAQSGSWWQMLLSGRCAFSFLVVEHMECIVLHPALFFVIALCSGFLTDSEALFCCRAEPHANTEVLIICRAPNSTAALPLPLLNSVKPERLGVVQPSYC